MSGTTTEAGRAGTLALAVALLVGLPSSAALAADESVLLEKPPTKSVEQDAGPLDRYFEERAPRDPVLIPGIQSALEDLPAFLRDTELGVDFRSYYFRRRFADGRDAEAWAIGGALRYRSGWLLDRLQLGATLFTSQKLYGPASRDGTGLLRPGQKSYTVVGESFVRLRENDHELTIYRHRLELPYLNGNDGRMTPNTFEGITLIGRHARLGYSGGHLLQIKRRNDDHFSSFSKVAGVPGTSSNGLSFAGLRIEPIDNVTVGAVNYFVKDTLNIAYTELEWFRPLRSGWELRLGSQFTHQRSVGDDRLTGKSFETWVWDAKVAASWEQAVVSLAVSVTDDEERVRNPWGSYPGYLGMMLSNFNAADEKAWGISASWYFDRIGVPDLSIALRYGEGYDRRDVRTDTKLGDQRQFNGTLDYRLSGGLLRGLWLRGRFAWGHVENTRHDSLEGRIVLRYEFEVL
jgi:hypothetical protein